MKLIICDDSCRDAEKARNIALNSGLSGLEIQIYTYEMLNSELRGDNFDCDIIILNINSNKNTRDKTGIEIARVLNQQLPDCEIIYLSDTSKLIVELYETNHCYHLPKSDMEEVLPKAIKKAYNLHMEKKHENKVVKLVCKGQSVVLVVREIQYVEKIGRFIVLHVGDKIYSSYMTLVNLQKIIGESFARCHGSFLVNMDYVKIVEKDKVVLDDGNELPVGRTYQNDFQNSYLNHWTGYMEDAQYGTY